jgi:hypothetical protein
VIGGVVAVIEVEVIGVEVIGVEVIGVEVIGMVIEVIGRGIQPAVVVVAGIGAGTMVET